MTIEFDLQPNLGFGSVDGVERRVVVVTMPQWGGYCPYIFALANASNLQASSSIHTEYCRTVQLTIARTLLSVLNQEPHRLPSLQGFDPTQLSGNFRGRGGVSSSICSERKPR